MISDNILAIIIVEGKHGEGGCMQKKYVWETADEIDLAVAGRARNIRRRLKMSQQELSKRSGVSLGSLKRFEQTGNISFLSLTKIAVALDAVDGIKALFEDVPYKSIEEVLNEWK